MITIEYIENDKSVKIALSENTIIPTLELSKSPNTDKDIKDIRQVFGLPKTKQIIYVNTLTPSTPIEKIVSLKILKIHNESEIWATFEAITEKGTVSKIDSTYLAKMQKPSFLKEQIELKQKYA